MRNLLLPIGSAALAMLCGPMGIVCLAAIPDICPDMLYSTATHIFTGEVLRVYSAGEDTAAEWHTIHCVAEIRIADQEKGHLPGQVASVCFDVKRYRGSGDAPPGDYGQRGVPEAASVVRVFATEQDDGGLDALTPNGFQRVSRNSGQIAPSQTPPARPNPPGDHEGTEF